MAAIGVFEAKSQFSALIERAEAGEEITITRHGKPVARLIGANAHDPDVARAAVARLREMRKGLTLGDLDIRSLRDEGRS